MDDRDDLGLFAELTELQRHSWGSKAAMQIWLNSVVACGA